MIRKIFETAGFLAIAVSAPVFVAGAQSVPDRSECSIDFARRCADGICEEVTYGTRVLYYDMQASTMCLKEPGQACQVSYSFQVARRADDGILLSFPNEGMMFILNNDGTMQGTDVDSNRAFTFQGRCAPEGGGQPQK